MKKLGFLLLSILLATSAIAAEGTTAAAEKNKEPAFSFFSSDVPRYTGFGVGGYFLNQYGIGDWSDFAICNLGLGINSEFTIPTGLPFNMDFGTDLRLEYGHVLPKSDSTLKSDDEFIATLSAWLRIPFVFVGQHFAFQPEFGYGIILHNAEGQNGSSVDGIYSDQIMTFSFALRWIPKFIRNFEIELSPEYTFSAEKDDYSLNQLGFRVGAVYHPDGFRMSWLKKQEEKKAAETSANKTETVATEPAGPTQAELDKLEAQKKAAADEAARKAEADRLAAEQKAAAEKARLDEIASWPSPSIAASYDGSKLTPDGDGLSDNVTFKTESEYLEEPVASWTLVVTDPKGNIFRTISGTGAMPENVSWDGLSDSGEQVFSRNTYKVTFSAQLSKKDSKRTGKKSIETSVDVSTGLLLQIIKPEHEWKIVVNTINFDADKESFDSLTAEQNTSNSETLDEVAEQIKAHPAATVVVEGYANNVSNTEKENTEELVPLSQKRAEVIVELLVQRGIGREILSAKGMGGSNPIAKWDDNANWWKNRRVEFIIKQ